jgi:hypothetical protein
MQKSWNLMRRVAVYGTMGTLVATNSCLPEDYWATLAGDTISAGVVGAVGTAIAAGINSLLGAA